MGHVIVREYLERVQMGIRHVDTIVAGLGSIVEKDGPDDTLVD